MEQKRPHSRWRGRVSKESDMKAEDVIAAKKDFTRDARSEMAVALIPLLVGFWSFQWAVLLGIFWLTVVVIEFARVLRIQSAHYLAFMDATLDERSPNAKDAR